MQSMPGKPTPRAPRKRRLIVALIVIAVVFAIVSAALILRPKTCFTKDSYRDLVALAQNFDGGYGVSLSDVSQNQDLLVQSIYFKDATTSINSEISPDADNIFKMIGTYYKSHQATAPITITLGSDYEEATTPQGVASQRIKTIRDSLVKAGVAETAIVIKAPVAATTDEESHYDEDVIDGMPASIRITPVSHCNE